MEKLLVFFVIALVANGAFGQGQAQQTEEDLEDRYGWNRPNGGQRPTFPGQNQNQFPNQFPGQFPSQNQNQFPGQNQNQFPGQNQNQFPGQNQNQFPGQNQNQFPGQNQNQFPGQNQNQFPGQNQNQFPDQFPGNWNQVPTARPNTAATTVPTPTGGPTTQSPEIRACITSCPVTAEYNPVCGSDNTTYTNPGRLTCAQLCGVNVSLIRTLPCPTTTVAPV